MLPLRMLGPLMLLSILPDWYSSCPLTLQPPALVQELGDSIVVNCTSPADGHSGITWKYGKNGSKSEDVTTFNELSVVVEWDTQAQCSIKLSDSYECSKDLQITVYKRPSRITVINNSSAFEETMHELQCEINDVAPVQNLTVMWHMNNRTMKTEHLKFNISTPTNVSSTLNWTVSREDDGALITCEVLLDLGPHKDPVVSSDTTTLSVLYAPIFQDELEYIYLNNSGNVSLHCEALGNPPLLYNWTKDGVTVAENTQYLNLSHVNENTTYNCTAYNNLWKLSKKFYITVMEATAAPTPEAAKETGCPLTITPDEIAVQYGGSTSANCSTSLKDAGGIGWEATTGGISLSKVTHLPWKVDPVKVWTITASCFINLKKGSQCEKPINITVYKTPDDVHVSPDGSDVMVEGTPHKLKCEIFNVAPVGKLQMNWYRGDVLVNTTKFNGSDVMPKTVSSILMVNPEKENNGANFMCEAELLLGQKGLNAKVKSVPYTADVQYKPTIQSCPTDFAGKEDEFRLDTVPCEADGNPKPVIRWYHEDRLINASLPLTRRESGKYTAKFENIIGSNSTTVNVIIEYPPSFSCKDQYDINENDYLGSKCEPEGVPKPESVWFRDETRVTSDRPRRQESGRYLIIATNKHGQANLSLSISVLYVPTFSMGNITKEFSPGENVILDCSAEGNPLPDLQWKYPPADNVRKDTRGRQIYVNVTGATLSNVGVYSCGATNKVGTVSRTVTLNMKEKTNRDNKLVWIVILLVIFLLIFVGVLLFRNYKKKQGHYTVVVHSDSIPLRSSAVSVV